MPASARGGRARARLTRPALIAAILVAGLGLSACDKTIRGAGQDIQDTGAAVGDAAN